MPGSQEIYKRVAQTALVIASLVVGLPIWGQSVPAQQYVNAQLPWHAPVLDMQGHLLAWYRPEENLGYDHVLRLAWSFLEGMPNDPGTGVPPYMNYAVFSGNTLKGELLGSAQNNSASRFAEFVDSLAGWYPYSGDKAAVAVVRRMLDYQLANGTTPADWSWAQVPFSVGCNGARTFGGCMTDMPPGYVGGIEPDKVGELGTGYVLIYEMTGDRKYLEAGIHCADALAKHVRPGDAAQTPWAFRLDGRTGTTAGGNMYNRTEEYGGMIVAPVRLFTELIRIHEGDVASYQRARKLAWDWIRNYPMKRESPDYGKWSNYFEDVPYDTEDVNQAEPTMTAYYILSQPDPSLVDPSWKEDVGRLIDWVRQTLGAGPFLGAWGINEQGQRQGGWGHVADPEWCCSRAGLGSDTSRWAAVNAMYYEKTGDVQARQDAFRSLNYATYFADSTGLVACCGMDYGTEGAVNYFGVDDTFWFDDGYADYLRHFLWAMGAIPEFAPKGQNHLLRSSSIVQQVDYGDRSVSYRTFDQEATEVLRLHFKPDHVTAGAAALGERQDLGQPGYTVLPLDGGDYIVRVRHTVSGDIRITG